MLIFLLTCFPVFPAFPIASAGIVTGNDFRNYLFGTMDADTILGKGANDRLHGLAGADIIQGGSGDDILEGDQGNDNLNGDDGNDIIIGGQDADTLLGGNGDDIIMASYTINSSSIRDFASDSIMCGLGNDTAYINIEDNDTASGDCENVISTSSLPYLPPLNTTSLEASNSPSSESNNSFIILQTHLLLNRLPPSLPNPHLHLHLNLHLVHSLLLSRPQHLIHCCRYQTLELNNVSSL